ncbi:T9SS type A sorting domain-containing protein [Hymenobacter sp. BT683]|uniref:T9SS type A sorting domain-containing protein n=1 Tax=Hymenobacter jeongseonensis TaxID=2791027 RepID=A0ABS0ICE3_9BACT|nr:T9SS type A sorting domain-containing protein [Hymenobacter jeongseonensis]MBF9236024.1 T9SS type A sorting domain-containing protein [Hymenobacter jeongseonensis]
MTPTSGSAAVIVINGFSIELNKDYVVGRNGSITVSGGGSLVGSANLKLGDGTGSQSDTKLTLVGSTVAVGQLTVDKASINVDATSRLSTSCNLILLNSSIVDNNEMVIYGNLDLSLGGANNTLCGSGKVAIRGCVFGGNGASNRIISNCAGSLAVPLICAQQQAPIGCAGPIAATNISESACDALVTTSGPGCSPFNPLPVELVFFAVEPTGRQAVSLRWTTASETNNESFLVERSGNGKSFRGIHTLAGAGTVQGRTSYAVVDEQPLPGTSYYRLRQTDFDGKATFSPVRAVTMGTARNSLAVYPGRTTQEWVVSSSLPAELLTGATTVEVMDAVGRVQAVNSTADATQSGRWTLDLTALPTGMYIVRLLTDSGAFSQRIAK